MQDILHVNKSACENKKKTDCGSSLCVSPPEKLPVLSVLIDAKTPSTKFPTYNDFQMLCLMGFTRH